MSQRLKVLLALLFMAIYTVFATMTINRNCPLCMETVATEYYLAVGAGQAHTIVHKECLVEAISRKAFSETYGVRDLENTYNLEEN